jgi:Arc/MetJ family transcription regulator
MTPTRKTTRLRITVNEENLAEAMQLSDASTTREVIEHSLQLLVRLKRQEQLRNARGFLTGIDTSIDRSDDRY